MPILNRHIGRVVLRCAALSLLALLGLFTFVNFLEELREVGRGAYELRDAMAYVALLLPRTLYELFPMAALLGAMLGLSLLAADGELIALRGGGVSAWQIAGATLRSGAWFALAAVLVGELLAPLSESRAQRGREMALHQNLPPQTAAGLWLRDADRYIHIGALLPDLTLLRVKLIEFDRDKKLRAITFAENGELRNDHWRLRAVQQTRLSPAGDATTARYAQLDWPSQVTLRLLQALLARPEQLSARQLHIYIGHLAANRQDTAVHRLAFWNKLTRPLGALVMMALAVSFAFAAPRSGALGRNMFIGILLGLGFYVCSRGFGYIALAAGWPPALGAALPLGVFGLLAMGLLRRVA